MARPVEFTEEVVKKLEEAFSIDATIEEACFYANISRQTYYNNVKEGSELFDRFDELRQRPVLKARQTIAKSLDNPQDAKWYLEKKRKKEFGTSIDLTSGGEKIGSGNPELAQKFDEFQKQQLRGDTTSLNPRLPGEQQD